MVYNPPILAQQAETKPSIAWQTYEWVNKEITEKMLTTLQPQWRLRVERPNRRHATKTGYMGG